MHVSVACVSSCTRVVQRASSRLTTPDGSGGVQTATAAAATESGGETSQARGRVRELEQKYSAVLHESQQRQLQLEAAQRTRAGLEQQLAREQSALAEARTARGQLESRVAELQTSVDSMRTQLNQVCSSCCCLSFGYYIFQFLKFRCFFT